MTDPNFIKVGCLSFLWYCQAMPGFTVSAVKGVGVAFSRRAAGGRGFLLARRTSHEVALYWEDLRRASLCRSCEGRSRAEVYRYPSPGLWVFMHFNVPVAFSIWMCKRCAERVRICLRPGGVLIVTGSRGLKAPFAALNPSKAIVRFLLLLTATIWSDWVCVHQSTCLDM